MKITDSLPWERSVFFLLLPRSNLQKYFVTLLVCVRVLVKFLSLRFPSVRLVWCRSQQPLCLASARRLLEVHSPLRCTSWPNLFHIQLFYVSSAKLLDRPLRRREGERLKGRFSPSSRPPNRLPPRSCVIYVERALACFCPRQQSAFSSDPLSLPQPARHHRVEINKSSGRVGAASLKLKKDF